MSEQTVTGRPAYFMDMNSWPMAFYVWTDLSTERLSSIPGVARVTLDTPSPGARLVFFDPRYSADEIKAEIQRLEAEA